LVFISNVKSLPDLHNGPAVIVTNAKIALSIANQDIAVITFKDARFAQALIKKAYSDYDSADSYWGAIHPNSVIDSTARLGAGVRVGPNTVIGADVEVGDDTHIRSNCVIEHSVTIGQNCVINNLVNIGYFCTIGSRVIIRPRAIIGNESFAFGQDELGRYHRARLRSTFAT
jgi:UDP-3-O-[3-hydroxymyristoyl] glucosamine N-acyltransferase